MDGMVKMMRLSTKAGLFMDWTASRKNLQASD